MSNKKIYKHCFTRDGNYIGCKEVTMLDLVKPYLFTVFGIGLVVGFIYLLLLDKNVKFDKERPPIILEVPSR